MLINLYEDRQDPETDIKVPDYIYTCEAGVMPSPAKQVSGYPFKKIHNREFSSLDLNTLASTFNSIIDKQNASSNHCNNNRICNTNPMININRDTQSSDGSISKQTRKEI